MLCLRRGGCTCRTNTTIDDLNATKKMTLRWRKFVVPAFGQKGGRSKGKKEERKKGKKGKN
jgi:hypothetical protein